MFAQSLTVEGAKECETILAVDQAKYLGYNNKNKI